MRNGLKALLSALLGDKADNEVFVPEFTQCIGFQESDRLVEPCPHAQFAIWLSGGLD